MQSEKSSIADRELRFTRTLNASIKLVWEVWTSPEHMKRWWGPTGFTNTIRRMDVRPGGKWELVMHGPDGTDYETDIVFKEVVPYKKIVYEQSTAFRCIATIQFERRGNKTLLHWQMLFESREYLIEAARQYGVDTGLEQTGHRLIDLLALVTNQ